MGGRVVKGPILQGFVPYHAGVGDSWCGYETPIMSLPGRLHCIG